MRIVIAGSVTVQLREQDAYWRAKPVQARGLFEKGCRGKRDVLRMILGQRASRWHSEKIGNCDAWAVR